MKLLLIIVIFVLTILALDFVIRQISYSTALTKLRLTNCSTDRISELLKPALFVRGLYVPRAIFDGL
jgi:hypothetical protein